MRDVIVIGGGPAGVHAALPGTRDQHDNCSYESRQEMESVCQCFVGLKPDLLQTPWVGLQPNFSMD